MKTLLLHSKLGSTFFILFCLLFFGNTFGQKTWDGGGDGVNWNSANNWNPNGVPVATDAVTLTNNASITVNITSAVCASLQLGGTSNNTRGILSFSASGSPKLIVTGAVTMGGSNNNNNRAGTITFVNGSTLECGSLTLGNGNNSPSVLTMSASSNLITGALAVGGTGTSWTPSTGTVTITSTDTLPSTIFTAFNNLIVNNGTTTAGVGFSIAGSLTRASGATLNMDTFAMTGATLTTSGTGTLITQNTSATPLPTGRTWSGTVQYVTTTGGQTVMSGTYSNLTLNNTSGIQLTSGNVTVNSSLTTLAGGTLNMGTSQLLGTLTTISNAGTIRTQNTSATPISAGKTWGGTVQFDGAGQSVPGSGTTFNNLTYRGSGTKTLTGAAMTISGDFTINTSVIANLGTFTSTANKLFLGGTGQLTGQYGGTTSGATFINPTFFATATGKLNVANCSSTGTWSGVTSTNWATATNWCDGIVPTAATNVLIISGGNQPVISSAALCNNITLGSGSTLTINSTLDVAGNWTNNGSTVSGSGTVTLSGSATIGGTSSTSFPNLTTTGTITQGINTSVSGNFNQTAGLYNQNAGATAFSMTVTGNFTLSGTSIYNMQSTNTGTGATTTVNGATGTTISGTATLNMDSGGAAVANVSIFQTTNFTSSSSANVTTGLIDFGNQVAAKNNQFRISGNCTKTGTAGRFYTTSNAVNGGLVFNGAGTTQTVDITAFVDATRTEFYNFTINTGAVVQLVTGLTLGFNNIPTCTITVNGTIDTQALAPGVLGGATNGTFILSSGGNLKTANPNGVFSTTVGAISNSIGTRTFNNAANYEFNGTLAQTANLPNVVLNNLTINNAAGVSLSQSITTNGILDFQNGLLNSPTATPIIIGASGTITNATSAKYVNGKLNRIYSSIGSKTFPVGKGGVYRPVIIEYTALTGTSTVSTEQIETALTGSLPASTNLNNARTWDISQTGGSAFIYKVTLDGTGDTVSGVVAMLKKESGTITSNAATTPNYTNTTDFTTLTGTNNFTLGSTCTVTSNAGSNQTSCAGSTFTLAANTPAFGTGAWTVTGPSNLTSQFSSTSSPTAIFTPAGGTGAYIATWTITNGSCSDATTVTLTSGGTTKTWTGSWSPSAPSGSTDSVIISANYTSAGAGAGSFSACTLTVDSGAVVSIASGDTVTLNGAITVSSGSFTLANNANLIQNTNVSNSGNISVARTTASLMRQDYVLWSSPVASQQLQSFSPSTLAARFYTYNSGTNQYVVVGSPSTTNFTASTGYLIRVPNNHPVTPTAWTGTFTGVPNNGDQGLTGLTSGLFYATGNPYPSAINANDFITNNSLTDPLYFWRKTNNTATSSYATYTTMGGVSNSPADPLALIPNGYIQVGQGFIAKTVNTTLNFTNALRVSNSGPFLRTMENRSRIWIDLNGADGAFGQILVGYMPGATAGNDGAIDGRFFGDSQTALTSTINDEEFIIQGRALPFETSDVVALGFKSEFAGSFTISLNHVDGLFEENNQNIYLKDNLTNITTDLRAGSYTFATEAGVFNNRFEIVYSTTLSVGQNTFNENSVVVYKQNQDLVINTGKIAMATVKVFDIQGRLLVEKKHINASETRINVGTTNQVLILKIDSESNGTVTKKVVN